MFGFRVQGLGRRVSHGACNNSRVRGGLKACCFGVGHRLGQVVLSLVFDTGGCHYTMCARELEGNKLASGLRAFGVD